MSDYIISTDTTADLPEDYITKNGLEILTLSYTIDGQTYERGHDMDYHEFYEKVRAGSMPTTSQVNPDQATREFERMLVDNDKDILHISFSSALSGTYNSEFIAAQDLMEKYPGRKIIVIDSLCASLGQGLLVHKAIGLKAEGKSIDEAAAWLEENKKHLIHMFTVDNLFHLHRGGRVSKATAIVGTMINIKPILHVDDQGRLINIDKVRGRKKSLQALVDGMAERLKDYDGENDTFFICHGDCIEDAEYVASLVKERFGIKDCLIGYTGPTIGAHSGLGTLALFFMGSYR